MGTGVYTEEWRPWAGTKLSRLDWMDAHLHLYYRTRDQVLDWSRPYSTKEYPKFGGVYFLIYADTAAETIAYIGMSNCIGHRLVQHWRNRMPFTHYHVVTGIPEMLVQHVESYFIHYFTPPLNNKFKVTDDLVLRHLHLQGRDGKPPERVIYMDPVR